MQGIELCNIKTLIHAKIYKTKSCKAESKSSFSTSHIDSLLIYLP